MICLSEAQQRAVESTAAITVVTACPGAGKTEVIVRRIVRLIVEGVEPHSIVAVTFTRAAAREIRQRVAKDVKRSEQCRIGTIHSLAYQVLADFGAPMYQPGLLVVDEDERAEIIDRIIAKNQLEKVKGLARTVLDLISRRVNVGTHEPATKDEHYALRVLRQYASSLTARNAIDLDYLVPVATDVVSTFESYRQQELFVPNHILVDEAQDLSLDQWTFIGALLRQHLFVVGDADQAIYGWREGDVAEFLRLAAKEHRIDLIENYRSVPAICAAAASLIKHNQVRVDTSMVAVRPPRTDTVLPAELVSLSDEDAALEASTVAGIIHAHVTNCGRKASEFAVLARTNAVLDGVERELLARDLLVYRPARTAQVWDSEAAKLIVALLRLHVNINDEAAWERVLAIGELAIEPSDWARWRLAQHAAGCELVAAIAKGGSPLVANVVEAVSSCSKLGSLGVVNPGWLVSRMLVLLDGILEYDLFASVASPFAALRAWADGETEPSVEAFLAWYATRHLDEEQASQASGALQPDAVTLTTVHGAKGLQWPVVFVVGCEEGLFPSARDASDAATLEESRRLFYVAMTRARDSLILCSSKARGRSYDVERSRFLAELGMGVDAQ